jgi:hypothetical protein
VATIACQILGITNQPEPSIPIDAFQDIENAISAVRILLTAFGDYELDDAPQFRDDCMLLAIASTHDVAPTFHADKFDVFLRNIAEFIDAKCEGRDPLLNHDENGVFIEDIENICRSLKSFGKCVFSIDGKPAIKLTNRRKWKTSNRDGYITMEVESATVVTALKFSNRDLIVSEDHASNLSPGDSFVLDENNHTTPIRRVIGSLADINMGLTTADMFDTDQDSE